MNTEGLGRVSCRRSRRGWRILIDGKPTFLAPDPVKPARLKTVRAAVERGVIRLKKEGKPFSGTAVSFSAPHQFCYVKYFADLMLFACTNCGQQHKFTHPADGYVFRCECGAYLELVFRKSVTVPDYEPYHNCPYCHATNERGGYQASGRNCRVCRRSYDLKFW